MGVPPHVGRHEGRARVAAEEVVPLRHQLLEVRVLVRRNLPPREERQLEPPLVVVIQRLVELRRIGGVDEDRQAKACRRLPHRLEIGIVHRQAAAVGLADGLAEALPDLADAHRAGRGVGLELRHRPLRPARPNVAEVDPGQRPDPVLHGRGRLDGGHGAGQGIARDVVGRDHQPHVEGIELRAHPQEPLARTELAGRVPVEVDDRELGLRHRVDRHHQGIPRAIVQDAGHRKLGCLAAPGPDLGHARGTLLPGLDLGTAGTARPLGRCGKGQHQGGAEAGQDEADAHACSPQQECQVTSHDGPGPSSRPCGKVSRIGG